MSAHLVTGTLRHEDALQGGHEKSRHDQEQPNITYRTAHPGLRCRGKSYAVAGTEKCLIEPFHTQQACTGTNGAFQYHQKQRIAACLRAPVSRTLLDGIEAPYFASTRDAAKRMPT